MRLAGGSASASVNWAKSGLRCASSNPNGTIFPLNTVTLGRMPPLEYDAHPGVRCPPWSTMPTLEYDAPVVCVASPACGIFKNMLTSFLIKLGSQIPFHIPRKHHTPSCTTSTTTDDFHSLHRSKYQNLMEYDCMRDSSKRCKNQDLSPIFHIIIFQRILPPKGGKKEKNLFRLIFLPI